MKKRVLFTILFVVAFSLLAAFSASAQEYELVDDLGDPSWYTGNYELMTDKTSQVVLSNGDGTYTAYPAYYILKYSITVSDGSVTAAYVNGFDYSFINENDQKNYQPGAIYKIELPYGLTKIAAGYFGHNPKEPNVVELVMPDSMTSIDDHALRGTTNLKKVVLSKNLTKIGEYAFYEAKGLEEFVLPAGSNEYLDISASNIFYGCSALEEADLSTRKIKKIGNACFSKCTALGMVSLPDTVEEIGDYFLFECYNAYLASDFLPTSLKKIGFQFLAGCATVSNRVIYFPEGFTGGEDGFSATYILATERYKTTNTTLVFLGKMTGTIALSQFHANTGRKLTLVFTQNDYADLAGTIVYASTDGEKAYIANTADTTDTDYFVKEGTLTLKLGNASDSHTKYKTDENGNTLYYVNDNSYQLIFCGGDDVEVCYGIRGNKVNSAWGNHITTPFTFDRNGHMTDGVHYDLGETLSLPSCGFDGVTENTCVVCDRVVSDIIPATGNHTLSQVSPCADKCSVCKLYIQRAEQGHVLNETLVYENGYNKAGLETTVCENEGCTHRTTEDTDPLFELLGYSTDREGTRLVAGYKVNEEAYNEYVAQDGASLSYGVVAYVPNEGETSCNPLAVENGAVSLVDKQYTIHSEINECYMFDFIITGFDATQSVTLAMCAYVFDGKEINYLCAENGSLVQYESAQAVTVYNGTVVKA